ncbi:Oxo-4-hydroxy-4-carboxy-5-ureidoimidazoline decarboxylase [Xylariomycetidae sp. FL0641]|nr:Oxo-4-hydroxy-4-carboxy-5-ureidoimidazoline decarboxylase [Xylariomycetidae sp. FL0641]
MASPRLPPVTTLPTAPDATLTAVLDTLFEPAPEIHALALPAIRDPAPPTASPSPSPFPSYAALITHVGGLMARLARPDAAPRDRAALHGILGAHPRLGAPKTGGGGLSALSAAEQARLQAAGEEEAEALRALNAEYEARFPGLRYVVFVNGRGRPAVMADMRRRIARGDIRAEEREGVQAMVDIALDRARKLGATD